MADFAAQMEKKERHNNQEGLLPLFKNIPFLTGGNNNNNNKTSPPEKALPKACFLGGQDFAAFSSLIPAVAKPSDLIASAPGPGPLFQDPGQAPAPRGDSSPNSASNIMAAACDPAGWLKSAACGPSQGLACLAEAAEHLSIMDWPGGEPEHAGRTSNRSRARPSSLRAESLLLDWAAEESDPDEDDDGAALTPTKRRRQALAEPPSAAAARARERERGGGDWAAPGEGGSGGTKLCCGCSQVKAKSEFCRNRHRKDGLGTWCRACNIAAQKRRRARHQAVLLPTVISKSCNKCSRVKASTEFGRDIYSRDGLNSRCKACRSLEWHRAGSRQQQLLQAHHQQMQAQQQQQTQPMQLQGGPEMACPLP